MINAIRSCKNLAKRILLFLISFPGIHLFAQTEMTTIDVSDFHSSSGQWHHNTGDKFVIVPLKNQEEYKPQQVKEIADNILLYQQSNGGWLKNYDMLAVLTEQQRQLVRDSMGELAKQTTFDNHATLSQVGYLAQAYTLLKVPQYKEAALRGINFILAAQYADNGGWPQFFPNNHGYQKYITFNDDVMAEIMTVLHQIVQNKPYYSFVPSETREKVKKAFDKGIQCILKCQVKEGGKLKGWCQQYDNIDLHPQKARKFEFEGLATGESVEIVRFLMSINHPSQEIINSINGAVEWFKESGINGIKIQTIPAPKAVYIYHTTSTDNIVVEDPSAPTIWTRFYELETNRPFFANKDGNKVYQFSDVLRERRTGYTWYGYWPESIITKEYPEWLKSIQ
jgi:PelA/Pel-15E family pectate lyase